MTYTPPTLPFMEQPEFAFPGANNAMRRAAAQFRNAPPSAFLQPGPYNPMMTQGAFDLASQAQLPFGAGADVAPPWAQAPMAQAVNGVPRNLDFRPPPSAPDFTGRAGGGGAWWNRTAGAIPPSAPPGAPGGASLAGQAAGGPGMALERWQPNWQQGQAGPGMALEQAAARGSGASPAGRAIRGAAGAGEALAPAEAAAAAARTGFFAPGWATRSPLAGKGMMMRVGAPALGGMMAMNFANKADLGGNNSAWDRMFSMGAGGAVAGGLGFGPLGALVGGGLGVGAGGLSALISPRKNYAKKLEDRLTKMGVSESDRALFLQEFETQAEGHTPDEEVYKSLSASALQTIKDRKAQDFAQRYNHEFQLAMQKQYADIMSPYADAVMQSGASAGHATAGMVAQMPEYLQPFFSNMASRQTSDSAKLAASIMQQGQTLTAQQSMNAQQAFDAQVAQQQQAQAVSAAAGTGGASGGSNPFGALTGMLG